MKHLKPYTLLALLLMAMVSTAKAQDYLPVVKDDAEWNIMWQSTSSWPTIQITESIRIDGDTLANDMHYKKVMRKISSETNYWHGSTEYYSLYGLIREEPEGKVFYQPIDQDTVYLLYDFNMNVNDTVVMSWCQIPNTLWDVTIRIDSITTQYIAGMDRRVFYVSSISTHAPNEEWRWLNTWIEGIGATEGLLYSCHVTVAGGITLHELLCYHEDGELVWQNPIYNTCLIDNYDGVQDNTEESGVMVYPNPVKNKVVINGVEASEVQVYNALGQLVKTVRGTNEIDLSGLVEGIYLLCIMDAEGKVYTNKITVQ